MECCMETRAFKSSLHGEFLSLTEQLLLDDMLCATATISAVSSDDFSVDDLLDFSSGEFEDGSVEEEDEKDLLSVSSQERGDNDDNNSNSSGLSSDQSLFTYEFVEPVDDLVELEWVSRFVDDSSRSEPSLLYPTYAENRFQPDQKPVLKQPLCFPSQIPSKARTKVTKRPRPTSRVWSSLGSPSSRTESRLTDSPVSSSSSSGSISTPCVLVTDKVETFEWGNAFTEPESEPEVKKAKKKPAVESGLLFQRRCSHCQTQKTPQWRTGPRGPKTLCNACGVRYKSGRLFPEYRPACSPTFSEDIHSNSHRKVLEMRKKKELGGPEIGLTQMVQSF